MDERSLAQKNELSSWRLTRQVLANIGLTHIASYFGNRFGTKTLTILCISQS